MRSILLICLLFAACGHGGRDIQEITLAGSGMEPYLVENSYNITFRRDGSAESKESRSGPDRPVEVTKLQRATITPEQFQALADTVASNGFFAVTGPDPMVMDASEQIVVVTTKGKQAVSVLGRKDEGLNASVKAIRDLKAKLKWEDSPVK